MGREEAEIEGLFLFFSCAQGREGKEGVRRVVHGKEKKADDEGRGKTGEEGWDRKERDEDCGKRRG